MHEIQTKPSCCNDIESQTEVSAPLTDPIPERKTSAPPSLRRSMVRVFNLSIFALFCMWLFGSPLMNHEIYDEFLKYAATRYPNGAYNETVMNGLERQEAFIPLSNDRDALFLHTWFFEVPKSKYVMLFHHGQGGNLTYYTKIAETFLQRGHSVLLYDYEGYGKSSGNPNIPAVATNGEAIYQWLVREKHVAPERIIQLGWSLGTSPAARIGTKYPCAGIILFSPYASLKQLAHLKLPLLDAWPDFMINYADLGSREALTQPHPPVLILHGQLDKTIPIAQADNIFAAADKHNLTYVRFLKSAHTDFLWTEPEKANKAMEEFFKTLP